jgi:hypothetical protein
MSNERTPTERQIRYQQLFCDMLDFFSDHVVLNTGQVVYSPEIREGTLAIASQYDLPSEGVARLASAALDMAQANALNCAIMTPEDFRGRAA